MGGMTWNEYVRLDSYIPYKIDLRSHLAVKVPEQQTWVTCEIHVSKQLADTVWSMARCRLLV